MTSLVLIGNIYLIKLSQSVATMVRIEDRCSSKLTFTQTNH